MSKLACILALILGTAACAKETPKVAPLCYTYADTLGVQWPDGAIVKSTITECTDDTFIVHSIGGESFQTDMPIVRIINTMGSPQLVYFSYL